MIYGSCPNEPACRRTEGSNGKSWNHVLIEQAGPSQHTDWHDDG